jgi:hypothetical protein
MSTDLQFGKLKRWKTGTKPHANWFQTMRAATLREKTGAKAGMSKTDKKKPLRFASKWLILPGDPKGTRTPVTGVRGRFVRFLSRFS